MLNSKKSVFIIDDNPDMLELGKLVLEMDGFIVHTAESGAEGLKLLSESPEPDLILLDMQLGDMTGSDFLLQMQSDAPVVFLTGTDECDIPDSRARGHIKKTTGVESLLASVHHFIKTENSRSSDDKSQAQVRKTNG